MSWTKVKNIKNQNMPFVSVNIEHKSLYFNVIFSQLAKLDNNKFVDIYIDEDSKKIGFKFKEKIETNDEGTLTKIGVGYYLSNREIFNKLWIKNYFELNRTYRLYNINQEDKLWVINLESVS